MQATSGGESDHVKWGDVSGELTELLERWGEGDRAAMAELIPLVYGELHSMARGFLRGERPGHTLQCTALVNEAYLRLVELHDVRWKGREQFFAISAQVLRHILVDYARGRSRLKRGAGMSRVSLDEALTVPAADDLDLEALDQSLSKLAKKDGRKAQIVELRYFAGLTIEQVAKVVHCSPMTVKREWTFAKAWLYRDLSS